MKFCIEDSVCLRDKSMKGVVDRTFGDVESHEPDPQRDHVQPIKSHKDIPAEEFAKFMKTGVPPRGTLLVFWQTVLGPQLIPESCLELLDRDLDVGDTVKRSAQDSMSGIVTGTSTLYTLIPSPVEQDSPLTSDDEILDVPAEELYNAFEYNKGDLVVYNDWVGIIEHVYDDVAIKLSNNSVVVVENAEELLETGSPFERLSVGDFVSTKKHNLRRGRWKYGAYNANIKPQGVVVETRTVCMTVHWLSKRFGEGTNSSEPDADLLTDDIESPSFHLYKTSGNAADALPMNPDGVHRNYLVPNYMPLGHRVRFVDLGAAVAKYDGTRLLLDGRRQGKISMIPRTETLGYDLNIFIVASTETYVTVQWQDLTVTREPSRSLLPDHNFDDAEELWPGDVICTNQQRRNPIDTETSWMSEPEKVGVVQSVNSKDRISTVRWFEKPNIRFLGDDLLPPSETGALNSMAEDISLYDVHSTTTLTRRRGEFVMLHPDVAKQIADRASGITWFGEVIDLGIDGLLKVRLGIANPVIEVQLPVEKVTLVFSPELYDDTLGIGNSSDGMSFTTNSDADWLENLVYTPRPDEYYEGLEYDDGDAEWSTEEEDDSWFGKDRDELEDDPMPDVQPSSRIDTSQTTPELGAEFVQKDPENAGDTNIDADVSGLSANDIINSANPLAATGATDLSAPVPFLVLDTLPPADHAFINARASDIPMKRVAKEHKILNTSLPQGIFVRTWESRLDLLRVLIIGPTDTPYEYAPFVIDFHLDQRYPSDPPEVFFHSWTKGDGPVNPNLYEDGKICLSLLGTWHADERNESWSSQKSTLLQVLVSILGLVLVKEPYYNEAGYDIHREMPETRLNSAIYSERAYFRARAFITHALTNPIHPFTEDLKYLYTSEQPDAPRLLEKAIAASRDILERSENSDGSEKDGLRNISRGAAMMLKRQVDKLEELKAS